MVAASYRTRATETTREQTLMMRRIAASKFYKYQPESDRVRPSLPPARRAPLRPGRKAGRLRRLPNRAGFRPRPRAPRSRLRIPGGAANQAQPAWDVVDDFPEDIPVMPRELKVIETYLAAVLEEFLEPMSLEAEKAAIETVKPDVE